MKSAPEEGTRGNSVLLWGAQAGGAQFVHGVRLPQTSEAPIDTGAVELRAWCHVLVDRIPDRGLEDVDE